MKITLKRFLFVQSGILDEHQIRNCINEGIKQINLECNLNSLIINVVKNRDGKHFGHTYCWIENVEAYNALIGLNLDGSERYEEIEDDSWVEPELPLEEAVEGITNWAEEDEIRERYEIPYIKKQVEPLIILPGIKYTDKQKLKTESEIGFIDIFPVSLTNYEEYDNYIFSKDIPDWLTEQLLYNFFKKFDSDNNMSKSYPKVIIKDYNGKKNLKIIFSPRNNYLATFIIKIVKKIEFSDGTNKKLIFFSQGKNKTLTKKPTTFVTTE